MLQQAEHAARTAGPSLNARTSFAAHRECVWSVVVGDRADEAAACLQQALRT